MFLEAIENFFAACYILCYIRGRWVPSFFKEIFRERLSVKNLNWSVVMLTFIAKLCTQEKLLIDVAQIFQFRKVFDLNRNHCWVLSFRLYTR